MNECSVLSVFSTHQQPTHTFPFYTKFVLSRRRDLLNTRRRNMVFVTLSYVSVSCNRTCHSADWGINGLICYGACNCVAIYRAKGAIADVGPPRLLKTLVGHKSRVNCVKWIRKINYSTDTSNHCPPGRDAESELVSGSVDKTVIVWKYDAADNKSIFSETLLGHSEPVNALDALSYLSTDGETCSVIATASSDSTVRIWRRTTHHGSFSLVDCLQFGTGFALDVALVIIPDSQGVLLACGCDDNKVHLYAEMEGKFTKLISLSGHEDWIRSLEFIVDDTGDILLASSAQDDLIRIWRLSPRNQDSILHYISVSELKEGEEIKMKEDAFELTCHEKRFIYAASLETVLAGHDNWIYSVKWQPVIVKDNGETHQPMCLLSASMDKTMMIWRPDTESGIWMEQMRVGEVGGNTLGFYGGLFSPDGQGILAHGYQGAFHQWNFIEKSSTWEPAVTCKGHFDAVQDIAWDKDNGEFLLSTSHDQTTRLHAPWLQSGKMLGWYEVARPQIHGYDLQCLTMISRYKFASGADEKVVRIFDAPKNFIQNFCNISGLSTSKEMEVNQDIIMNLPEGASVPGLGLSNKAVFPEENTHPQDDISTKANNQYTEMYFTSVSLQAPPSEEHLLQNTLWPETQKLYGHGYEIFSIAAHPSGRYLASACKTAKAEFAGIIIWDTTTWKQVCTLDGPTLTITQLNFSHSGQFLLATSRDRTWFVYSKGDNSSSNEQPFKLLSRNEKRSSAHARIIWSGAWSHDDIYFATASRDKKVLVWKRPDLCSQIGIGNHQPCFPAVGFTDSVTAVDFAPCNVNSRSRIFTTCVNVQQGYYDRCCFWSRYLIAAGLENGYIYLYELCPDTSASPWLQVAVLSDQLAHHYAVKRLRFRPCPGCAGKRRVDDHNEDDSVKEQETFLQLASCSSDHSVRIFDIALDR